MGTADVSAVRASPKPGDTLDGKYALISVLGKGGMGIVFEAEHLRLKQRCAIKMLSPAMLGEQEIVTRFEREARASALLKGPHVTRVTDVATTADGLTYIVMELLAGRDLNAELEERGRLPYQEAIDYVLQACAAVAEAHAASIIHRDLKPGNLFLAREESGLVVKVLDFGISKMMEETSLLTTAGATMGTALYMSPEQLRSASTVDARSDIWSLGVILYELVCGGPPFTGSPPQIAVAIVSADAPDITKRVPIPPELGLVIHRMIEREPSKRYASIAELVPALTPFAEPGSLGVVAASQIARRISSRSLPVEAPRSSRPELDGLVDVEAATIARDVSTGVSHEVNTGAARGETGSRSLLIVAIAVVALVVIAGGVGMAMLRGSQPIEAKPAAAASASVVIASESPIVVPEVPVVPTAVASAPSASVSATSATSGTVAAKPRPRATNTGSSGAPPASAHPPAPKPSGGQAASSPPFL
jgi:eukaryotic-like serine/threonine-protein kinase